MHTCAVCVDFVVVALDNYIIYGGCDFHFVVMTIDRQILDGVPDSLMTIMLINGIWILAWGAGVALGGIRRLEEAIHVRHPIETIEEEHAIGVHFFQIK